MLLDEQRHFARIIFESLSRHEPSPIFQPFARQKPLRALIEFHGADAFDVFLEGRATPQAPWHTMDRYHSPGIVPVPMLVPEMRLRRVGSPAELDLELNCVIVLLL